MNWNNIISWSLAIVFGILDFIQFFVNRKEKHQDQLKQQIQTLGQENECLKHENNWLEQRLSIKDKMNFKDGIYFFEKDEKSEIPSCPVCYGSDEKVVPLSHINNGYKYTCQKCSAKFGDLTNEQDNFHTDNSDFDKQVDDIINYNPYK